MRKTKAATIPANTFIKIGFAAAGMALALIAVPHSVHAQGVFRGMDEGAREGTYRGGRTAGPVGAVVGGAIGAGVGGAAGAVNGVLGGPGPRYRCRGYYRHGRYYCYR